MKPLGIEAFEPGGGVAEVTPSLGSVAKPSYQHHIEHCNTGGHLLMSSWNNIMNTEETLTWVDRHVVTATDRGVRRMG